MANLLAMSCGVISHVKIVCKCMNFLQSKATVLYVVLELGLYNFYVALYCILLVSHFSTSTNIPDLGLSSCYEADSRDLM